MMRTSLLTGFLLLVLLASTTAISWSMARKPDFVRPVKMDIPNSVIEKILPSTPPLGSTIPPLNVSGVPDSAGGSIGRMTRISVNGQDVAQVMGLQLYKYRYQLPAGEKCTIHLFSETWTAGANQPEIQLLHSNTHAPTSGDIFMQVPTPQSQRREVNIAGANLIASARPLTSGSEVIGYSALENEEMTFDQNVTLLQVGVSARGVVEFGPREAIAKNDLTVFYKLRAAMGINKTFER